MIPDCIIHWTWQDRLQLLSSSSFKNTMYYRHIEVLSISLAHEYQKSYMHVSNCRPQYSEECHCIRGQNVLFPREDAQAFSTHGEWCRQSIVLPDRLARRTLSLSLQPSCISCMHYAYTKLNQPWTRCVRTASTRDHRSLTDSLNWVSITKGSLPQTYWRTLWKYYTSKKKG